MQCVSMLLIAGALFCCVAADGGERDDLLRRSAELRRTLERRFTSPDGVLYDYAGPAGEVVLPTPEECTEGRPNALGWWTPIENGGFFTGLYLVGLCEEYACAPSEELRSAARRSVRGLVKLQDTEKAPGFIARGFGVDGKACYAASSNDQNFPWLLGLWRYLQTDIPAPEERRELVARIVRHAEALRANNWVIPGRRPGFDRGWWLGGGYHSAVHLATVTFIVADLTGDGEWRKMHDALLREKLSDGRTRIEWIARGYPEIASWSAWFTTGTQYAVRMLLERSADPELRMCYAESLLNTARPAAALIRLYRNFDPSAPREFTPDWRRMMPPWRPQTDGNEAQVLAMEQLKVWEKACPAVRIDKATLKPSIASAWIVLMSRDEALIGENLPEIHKAFRHFDPDRQFYGAVFFLENLAAELLRRGEPVASGG